MKINSKLLTGIYVVALSLAFSSPILAADIVEENDSLNLTDAQETEQARVTRLTQADDSEGVLEEVITTGTRSTKPRSAADSRYSPRV